MEQLPGYDKWKNESPYDDYDDKRCDFCGDDLIDGEEQTCKQCLKQEEYNDDI